MLKPILLTLVIHALLFAGLAHGAQQSSTPLHPQVTHAVHIEPDAVFTIQLPADARGVTLSPEKPPTRQSPHRHAPVQKERLAFGCHQPVELSQGSGAYVMCEWVPADRVH